MIKGGPKIVTDGLKVCLDAHDAKSYAGEPTTNFFYRETPRIDNSYSSYVYNSDSTWAANHPDAIRVYNTDGTEISSYVNTGANSGNWNVISHAHWVYDDELKKPVVRMHSIAGYESQWRALSRNLYQNLSQLGLTTGDKFTISWLQKAYVTGVYARAGLYMRNTGGGNGFHAGQATSSDVGQLSSELGKWAHKSKTFTVPSGMNETGYNVGLYMYGHYSPTHQNEILISDVQVEAGDYATPIVQGVSSSNSGYWGARSATNGWVDRSGNSNSGTLTNMIGTEVSHYRDGEVIMPVTNSYLDFDGTDDYVTLGQSLNNVGSTASIEVWFKSEESIGSSQYNIMFGWGDGTSYYSNFSIGNWFGTWGDESIHLGVNSAAVIFAERSGHGKYHDGNWHHAVATIGANNYAIYVDGSAVTTSFYSGTQSTSFTNIFNFSAGTYSTIGSRPYTIATSGSGTFNGKIPLVRVYDKILTAAEVLSNYNATKGRFS